MSEVTSGTVLDAAFAWLCKRRVDYADSANVWKVRRLWPELKTATPDELSRYTDSGASASVRAD